MKRNLLFVAYRDGELDEGLNYAVDLAKMTDKNMSVLLINRKKLSGRIEEIMNAVAFAEENETEAARQCLTAEAADRDIRSEIEEKCRTSGIAAAVYTGVQDASGSLRDYLRQNSSIDMVLLSPNITEDGSISTRELSRLVRSASKPIVTMAKQPQTA